MNYLYLFERDNEVERLLISKESLQAIIDGMLFILLILSIPFLRNYIEKKVWSLFTPGQEWLEITTIVIGIAFSIIGKLLFDELTNLIDNFTEKVKYLNQQNEAQNKQIAELEDENADLKKQLEKKTKALDTIDTRVTNIIERSNIIY